MGGSGGVGQGGRRLEGIEPRISDEAFLNGLGADQELFVMYLEHRMPAFQGTLHANPGYAPWRGWSEMQRDLTRDQDARG